MDEDLRVQLELINQNLNTIIHNQARIYDRLERIEQELHTETEN